MRKKILILAVVIVLAAAFTSSTAQSGERRRGAANSQELDGLIKTVSATSMVIVDEQGKEFTIALTSSTVVRKGEQTIAVADLKKDDRVEVKVTMNGNTLTALLIEVKQAEEGREQDVEGVVVTVSADSLTIRDEHGKEVKIALTSSTVLRRGNATITIGDLKTDELVDVKATLKNNVLTALLVEVKQGENEHGDQELDGVVVTASSDSLTISEDKKEVKIALTPSTIIRKGNQKLTGTDLKKDDKVHVKTTVVNNVLTALEVLVGQQDDNQEEGEH